VSQKPRRAALIQDESHPQMKEALRELEVRLEFYIGHDVNKGLVDSYNRILKENRAKWRAQGVDFPVLVAIMIPRLGTIDLRRADLPKDSICQEVINLVRATPEATMEEIVMAFRAAYPDFHPDDIAQYRQRVLNAKRPIIKLP
jgi:hypothetical protein